MGSINLKHTGAGGAITLSSDGTSLLLDGSAVGGGGGDLITSTSFPSTGFTLTNSDKGKYYHMTGSNQTVTLPASSAISAGWYVFLSLDKNAVYRLDIAVASGDSWYNGEISTYSIYSGNTVLVVYRGSGEWGLIGNDYYMATSAYGSGSRPTSNGARAVAIGASAVAVGNYTYAFGKDSYATGLYATAMTRSRASAASAFAAAIDTNSSSYGASGANSIAIGKNAKATTGNAVAIGSRATASASASMSFSTSYANYGNVSSAANAITMGDGNAASATSAIATGYGANSDVQGKHAHANGSFGDGNAEGSAQRGTFVLRCDTTDATAEALRTNTGAAATANQITLPNNSCYGFTGTIIAREDSSSTNDFAVWEIKGGAVRAASAATTALGTYNINKISESAGAANWSIALSADTTNGAVAITVTGEASHNIRWVATVNTTEVIY